MRVLLVGTPEARTRLRARLERAAVEIAGEFQSPAAAEQSGLDADAIVLAPGSNGRVPRPHEEEGLDAGIEPLTPREIQVLELMAEGLPNKAIAARLGISDQTVKFHVSAIGGKLGAANRTDAVRRAARRGLIVL